MVSIVTQKKFKQIEAATFNKLLYEDKQKHQTTQTKTRQFTSLPNLHSKLIN